MERARGSKEPRKADGSPLKHSNRKRKRPVQETTSNSYRQTMTMRGRGYFTKTSPLPESISKVSVSIFDVDPLTFLTFSSRPFGSESSLSKSITHDAVSSSHLTTSFGAFDRSTVRTSVTFESLSLSKVSLSLLTKSLEATLATTGSIESKRIFVFSPMNMELV